MNVYAYKVLFYCEAMEEEVSEFGIIAGETNSDAINKISNWYDEKAILEVQIKYLEEQSIINDEMVEKYLEFKNKKSDK